NHSMKRIAIVLTLTSLLFLLFGCHMGGVHGSGVRKTEKRDLPSFNAIETTGAFEVQVNCQKPASFEIEGDDNILPLIQTEVRNGVLRVSSTTRYSAGNPISLRITVPDLASISSTGAGKFTVSDLKNESFEIHSTGAGLCIADGQTNALKISSTGAGKIDTHDLRASKVEVRVTGAATVEVYANDQLDVNVSGAGSVTYSGDPKVTRHVSGAGQVNKKQESGV
ncbi:MAG: head GIN domain-containing protein, partial [Acidobacteriota bacterium]